MGASPMRVRISLLFSVLLTMPAILFTPQASVAQTPTKMGCFDSKNNLIGCNERFIVVNQGTVYDCVCNCSGSDQCTPRSQPGSAPRGESRDFEPADNSAAVDKETERVRKEEEKIEKERRDIFNREHESLIKSMKGSGAVKTGETALKLKGSGTPSQLGLKTAAPAASNEVVSPAMRQELLRDLSATIKGRNSSPSREAAEILQSLKTNKPPSLVQDPFANLATGDVILIDKIPFEEREKFGWKDMAVSQAVNFADQLASANYTSKASHVALFLGERNGKRWFLNNTTEHGPVIIQESEFLRLYGGRGMDVARLVGKPISKEEGEKIWKEAHEQRNTKEYGIWSKDRMVCSESARWALMSTGRDVPEQSAGDIKFLGTQSGVNKKEFVDYSPADFYDSWQYFVVRPLIR
jgi:hypothetical protein